MNQLRRFSLIERRQNIQHLSRTEFDVLIIGGGITGAGIARDAALRGLTVALIEKNDFASGTSSKSSNLIHGGLRYLEQYHFGLIYKASNERRLLAKLNPYLIKPLPFIFPVFKSDKYPLWMIRIGMFMYDAMALFRNEKYHQIVNRKKLHQLEPCISQNDLRGGAIYYDCVSNDSRLTIEAIASAYHEGAQVANYVSGRELIRENDRVTGVKAYDELSKQSFDIRAKVVVNATGPWSDDVRHQFDQTLPPILHVTKGTHLVFPKKKLALTHAIVMNAKQDNRITFVIPWGNFTIVGTTDTLYHEKPEVVCATKADVDYLMESLTKLLDKPRLTKKDIISTYAGLRPLVKEEGKKESGVSREEKIFMDGGFVSISGGKLTTYRQMAVDVVNRIIKTYSLNCRQKSNTHRIPFISRNFNNDMHQWMEKHRNRFNNETWSHLLSSYGMGIKEIVEIVNERPDFKEKLTNNLPHIQAEIVYVIRFECAITLIDIMRRRTQLMLENRDNGLHCLDVVSMILKKECGYDDAEIKRQQVEYTNYVALQNTFRVL